MPEVRSFVCLIADLLRRSQDEGQVATTSTFDDVMAATAGLSGVVNATPNGGSTGQPGWRRYLEIHLAGLRNP